MYYTKLMSSPNEEDEDIVIEDNLTYYCQQCGHEEPITDAFTSVLVTNATKTEQSYKRYINKYTKLDPTLPRTSRIYCPNDTCPTHAQNHKKDEEIQIPISEIIYIRYDDVNMKYVYLCVHCDHVWNNENKV
jgi:DNA-directed RNA polymerase subunit M/transcription elongation factor TFIIS